MKSGTTTPMEGRRRPNVSAIKVDKSERKARTERDAAMEYVVPEKVLPRGRMWRMATGHAVVYVTDPSLACTLLQTTRKKIDGMAMATYTDRKGRTFAWQLRLPSSQWASVVKMLMQP